MRCVANPLGHRLRRRDERGIALLVVLSTLALVSAAVADFQFTSRVEYELAVNSRDSLQAEYNALSALRLKTLLLKNGQQVTQVLNTLIPQEMRAMMPPVGQLLEMVPVDCGLMSAITKVASDEEPKEGEAAPQVFEGECSAASHAEEGKISVLALAQNARQQLAADPTQPSGAAAVLTRLLSAPMFEKYFDEDDANGSHAESPAELVGALADWVDSDTNQALNSIGDEDRLYAFLKHAYKAKNAPFDSTAELQMVFGVNDALFDVLKQVITVYSDRGGVVDPSQASTEMLVTLMFSCWPAPPPTADGLQLMVTRINEAKQLGGAGFALINTELLKMIAQEAGMDAVIGPACLETVFGKSATSNQSLPSWYRITAEGQVGNATRRVQAMFHTHFGTYYYFRME